jgi:hypothetical protein
MEKENTPNAGKLIKSLRNTGYDSYSAIADIIDNSIDAGAKNIRLEVRTEKKDISVLIADDGIGMSDEVLDDALKLGSNFQKDERSDLGKYGMGLITASISMAKKLEVITKQENGEYLYACQDLDLIEQEDKFIKEQSTANQEQIKIFDAFIKKGSGTIVKITKVDQLSDSNLTQFSSKLSRDLSEIFRKFLDAGTKIELNGKLLEGFDPLMRTNDETEIFSDEEYYFIKDKQKYAIRAVIAILPKVNSELEREYKMNTRTQGFYVMRNNRQIAMNETFGLYAKHNNLNRLRIEMSFDSSLDQDMGLRFTKAGINPKQAMFDFLKQELGGQISTISKKLNRERIIKASEEVNHNESSEVIARKSKLLLTPKAEIETRSPRTNSSNKEPKGTERAGSARENLKNTRLSPAGIGARFETVSLGYAGVLYECYQEGKVIVIQWNIDHPFYDKVVLANRDNKNIVSALDYLVFGFAAAEKRSVNDDNEELLQTIKSEMSSNLRALLS